MNRKDFIRMSGLAGASFMLTSMKAKTALIYPAGTSAPNRDIDIVIMCGQSNMEGGNPTSNFSNSIYTNTIPNAIVFFKNNTTTTDDGKFQTLLYGTNQNWRSATMSHAGPEESLGYDYTEKLCIIKYSLGGSTLVDDGVTNVSAGLWDVNGNAGRAGSFGLHYNILRDSFLIPAMGKIIAQGLVPKSISFSWCQGESDSTVLYCANNYEVKLKQLINAIKSDLLPYTSLNLNVVITRIHNNFDVGTRPYLSTVRTALVNVANYYSGYWINSDAYPLESDNTHWTKNGQVLHGLDISTILKSI